ncbi:hypothetical protein ACH4SP_05005 [Streptomyces sp. NPDC021093]|uniref:hypothetical protein n=1 Tax=Streptomyces sp. NPDC021093 TaxID=3365112 RepID=UPI0037A7F7F9
MTAQPHHDHCPVGIPPMKTLADLRSALASWGFPGDLAAFEGELDAADLDNLAQFRELTQAYRHRVLLRCDPQAAAALARPADDVLAELHRKMGTR